MRNRIIISIESIARIESWLKEDIAFQKFIFTEELKFIAELFDSEEEMDTSEDEIELILKHRKYNYKCKNSPDNPMELAFEVGKNLIFDFSEVYDSNTKEDLFNIETDNLRSLWEKHITCQNSKAQDVYTATLLLVCIYTKFKITNGFMDFYPIATNEIPISKLCPNINYTTQRKIRKEMIELFLLTNSSPKTRREKIRIAYRDCNIEINNTENWFNKALQVFFDSYLHTTIERSKIELADYNINYTEKKGRKPNKEYNNVVIGLYNLLKRLPETKSAGLSDNEANFILGYLMELNIINEQDEKNDIINLRANINILVAKKYSPNWWNPLFGAL